LGLELKQMSALNSISMPVNSEQIRELINEIQESLLKSRRALNPLKHVPSSKENIPLAKERFSLKLQGYVSNLPQDLQAHFLLTTALQLRTYLIVGTPGRNNDFITHYATYSVGPYSIELNHDENRAAKPDFNSYVSITLTTDDTPAKLKEALKSLKIRWTRHGGGSISNITLEHALKLFFECYALLLTLNKVKEQ
jgi:hypothetical protein